MRPRNIASRDRLEAVLSRLGPASAPELAAALSISTATARRILDEASESVIAAGQARRRRYAWRRALRGNMASIPIYTIDALGQAHAAGALTLTRPQGGCHWLPPSPSWPLPPEARDGWWDGLPYPLQDMRPQGYMGRLFARACHERFQVDVDPQQWSDDDVLAAISQAGADLSGNLVIGEAALRLWQTRLLNPPAPVVASALGPHYVGLAENALSAGMPGSSAGGEFPKFTAVREFDGARTPHVIVKFSGADDSAAVRRWSDLLVCEHLALMALGTLTGQVVARSRIVLCGGRTFLESERFDRHGLFGRSPLTSLGMLDGAFLGAGPTTGPHWPTLARRLANQGLMSAEHLPRIGTLWHFGDLIGNTDMHTGNLSFEWAGTTVQPAPTYDMLPMMYAPPRGGEVATPPFAPKPPLPEQREMWLQACAVAIKFWQAASTDSRISEEFRGVARRNLEVLERLRDRV